MVRNLESQRLDEEPKKRPSPAELRAELSGDLSESNESTTEIKDAEHLFFIIHYFSNKNYLFNDDERRRWRYILDYDELNHDSFSDISKSILDEIGKLYDKYKNVSTSETKEVPDSELEDFLKKYEKCRVLLEYYPNAKFYFYINRAAGFFDKSVALALIDGKKYVVKNVEQNEANKYAEKYLEAMEAENRPNAIFFGPNKRIWTI